MAKLTVDLDIEDIERLVTQLPAAEFIKLAEAIEERAETLGMMEPAGTGFREWEAEGEDIYDAEAPAG
jgi:hypothetical protein